MKNSSTGSSLFVRADNGSAVVLFSAKSLFEGLCLAVVVLLSKAASAQPPKAHVVPEGLCLGMCARGRHSINSLASSSTDEAPTAAGLSDWRVIKRSMEEERVNVLTAVSAQGEIATPVSTLVSESSSSCSRRRWERERVMEGREGESR